MSEHYTTVAFIALRDADNELISVPLYVKVSEVTKNGVSKGQEELIHKISAVMIRRYEKQISEHFEKLKKEQSENENNTVSS